MYGVLAQWLWLCRSPPPFVSYCVKGEKNPPNKRGLEMQLRDTMAMQCDNLTARKNANTRDVPVPEFRSTRKDLRSDQKCMFEKRFMLCFLAKQ
jgi:hypothetical protein